MKELDVVFGADRDPDFDGELDLCLAQQRRGQLLQKFRDFTRVFNLKQDEVSDEFRLVAFAHRRVADFAVVRLQRLEHVVELLAILLSMATEIVICITKQREEEI